jgi:hypothetical protein
MRPKTIVLVLALGVVMLGCLVALKAVLGGARPSEPPPMQETNPVPAAAENNLPPITNIVATTPKQDEAAQMDQDLEALRGVLADEPGNPQSLVTIADRLVSPIAEVRKEAVVTAMHLGDTNILPYLTGILPNIGDAHEKAAVMDAIDYLKLLMKGEEGQTNTANLNNSEPGAVLPSGPKLQAVRPTAGVTKPAGGK